MGRSSRGRRRPGSEPSPAPADGAGSGPTLSTATVPRVWQGVGYRPLANPDIARPVFDFAAVAWPERGLAFGWGAFLAPADAPERLIGAVGVELTERSALLHGPVVTDGDDRLEVAAQLVAAALDHAGAAGAETVFTRPLGLDRVWVRFGFIPVPESTLPSVLAGRPGAGLYAWRGGSALWTLREPARDVV